MTHHLHHVGLLALLAVGAVAGNARAGDFQVEPTRLDLARRGAATELTITNRGTTAVRFEAKAFAWREDEQGVMQLAPTRDVIVYPTLFALEPGTARAIRIAGTVDAGAAEQAYRVFVEQLPAPRAPAVEGVPARIAVLTRIGVPVFFAPLAPKVAGTIAATVSAGHVQVAVTNRGSVHVKVASVRVIGSDGAGHVIVDQSQPSWYLLAGRTRRYELALDPAVCGALDHLVLEAASDRGTWRATVALPAGSCPSPR